MVKPLAAIARLRGPATLGEAAANQLRESIISGALPPGTLLRDVEVASRLGLSPIPLREAMVQLAAEGLIEIEANRLKRVTPMDYRAMVELLEVQQHLWDLGYAWGAPRLVASDFDRLKRAYARHAHANDKGDTASGINASHDFHLVLMEASGNRELVRVSVDRLPLIHRFVLLCIPSIVSSDTLAKQYAVLEALERGDLDRGRAMFHDVTEDLLIAARAVRDWNSEHEDKT